MDNEGEKAYFLGGRDQSSSANRKLLNPEEKKKKAAKIAKLKKVTWCNRCQKKSH
jgi:hypothetical protein